MPHIGDVYVPVITELSADKRRKENKVIKPLNLDEPIVVPLRKDIRELRMRGVLIPEGAKSEDAFAEDLMAVAERDPAYNHLDYAGVDGFVAVDDIEIPKSAEIANLREYSINGKFLPRTVYERAYKFRNEIIVNDFGIGFPAVIPLPVGAYNVKLKSPWQTINLDSYWVKVTGKDGDIPFYKPFPLFDQDNATTTGTVTYLEEAYRLQTINLDAQGEYAQWTVGIGSDIPKGTYKIVLRVRDDNVADDIKITVSGSVSGTILTETLSTGGTSFVTLETSEFNALTEETLTIKVEKATSTANVIELDYCYIEPTYIARLAFDVDQEYDVGEVKVYDTMGTTDESQWIRVFNKEHKFTGKIVVENGFLRFMFDPSTTGYYGIRYSIWNGTNWSNLGEWQLYAFNNDPIEDIKINSINSDRVELVLSISGGLDYAASLGDRLVQIWNITKAGVEVFNDKIGSLRYTNYIRAIPDYSTLFLYTKDKIVRETTEFSIPLNTYFISITTGEMKTIAIHDANKRAGFYSSGAVMYDWHEDATDFKMFFFDRYESWLSNLFKEAEDATLSSAPDPLTYTDDFSIDTSSRYLQLVGTGWTWDTANGELDAYSDTESTELLRLKSLKFAGGTYQVDVRINSTNAVARDAGIVFGLQDVANHYLVRLNIDSGGSATCNILKKVDGTWTSLASAPVTATTGTWYNIRVEWDTSTGIIEVYFDGAEIVTVSAQDTTFTSGYVGLRATATAGVGNLDVSFDNLSISATEVIGRGAQVNRFLDDFDWDSSAEYTQSEGVWSWDGVNGTVKMEDTTVRGILQLNSLKFGTGSYEVRAKITNSDPVGREAGILFCISDTNNMYLANIYLDSSIGKVVLWKRVGGTWSQLAAAARTINLGEFYKLKVNFDSSTGQIDVYFNDETTPCITKTDTTFSNGYVGLWVNVAGAAEFDDLEINAEEVTSSGNSCVILGGINHGGKSFSPYEYVQYRIFKDKIPSGRYLAVARIKKTISGFTAYVSTYLYDTDLDNTPAFDGAGKFKHISSDITSTYGYFIRPFEKTGDSPSSRIDFAVVDENMGTVIVDYFLLIPISGLESSQLFPQDIAFLSMVDPNLKRVLEIKN
ncbi:hypothetical protein Asulf_01541 [Archaeoglobus sulfaticallidus PM70-1]|uniref:DUF1080 domain-containing protein n=1 Tax=Archaeoglobus sulfaticallidus PM70-1 TaxID=387631 RepID=N0BD44_9EURY|nr:hypothetical protein [Archaeoglobus sulfaticallidus]AGK61519.1 hypothetical protein Asulf_01541 [Archaeoglobus sulfaticallidus PM70-1]